MRTFPGRTFKLWYLWMGVALLLAACTSSLQTPTPTATYPVTVTPAPSATPSITPSATPLPPTATATSTPSPSPTPTATGTPSSTPTPVPTPTSTPLPDDLWIGAGDLRLHPDGGRFYSGDLISFEVEAHHGHDWAGSRVPDVGVAIWLGTPDQGELIAEQPIRFYGARDAEARLEWVWDTAGLSGAQTLTVVLDPDDEIQIGDENPDNNLLTYSVELYPRDGMPVAWADAQWLERESACCTFHYLSGTAAERDIEHLVAVADEATAFVGAKLTEPTDEVGLDVYLIDRVLGHGGFAGAGLILSYLDRFYAGGDLTQVFRHEATHVLDRGFADTHATLLTEGLAVYVSGGHFREGPIPQRAAALLALDRYIPLAELADDFYPQQHETGYLEAASFVGYLVERFGWESFKAFYGDLTNNDAGQAAMIDAALQDHFGVTLERAEADWLAVLRDIDPSPEQVEDLRLTLAFYDTVRRYQQLWDPSAYFLGAWLPEPQEAEKRGITADFQRHPSAELNVTLETMFVAADEALARGAYPETEALLDGVTQVLDAGELAGSPLAEVYRTLADLTTSAGYEAQRIELDMPESIARVWATEPVGDDLIPLTFSWQSGVWTLASWGN
jgi:hypothetical protein